jgi:hypothetical protein
VLHYQKIDHKPFHFGYTLGINTMDFAVYPSDYSLEHDIYPEVNKLSPGVDIGIVTNFQLSKYLDFRVLPGISLGQRNLLYYENVDDNENENEVIHEMKLGSTFINVPFLLRYEAQREKNYRPYLILGTNLRWDMARNKDFNVDEGIFIKLEPFDAYLEGGFGIDFYLPYFKLSTELKFSIGMMNVLSPDVYSENPDNADYSLAIDKLKSRMVSLSFHFE